MLNLMKDSSRYSTAARSCKIRSEFGTALLLKIPASEEKKSARSHKGLETKAVTYAVNNVRPRRASIYLCAIGNGENAQAVAWIIDDLAVYRRKGRVRGDRKNI